MTESIEVTDRPENAAQLADMIESLTVFDYADDGDGYQKSADALWKAAQAAFDYAAHRVGATGFQASWSALRFYGEVMMIKGPFIILKAEDALFPQYDLPQRVEKFLAENRGWLRERAIEKLEGNLDFVADRVADHWRQLAETKATR